MNELGLGLDRLEKAITQARDDGPAPEGRERRSFLGGSDCAAVIGMSPWATKLDVYFAKTGTKPPVGAWQDPQRERNFRRGKRAEPHAIDMAIEDFGLKVTRRSARDAPNYHVDPEHPFLAAEIDFEWEVTPEAAARFELDEALIGTTQNGEVKSVHPFASAKFGEAETDEVPVEYAAQAMHGLMVTGRQLTMFLVLTGWDDLTVYWIRRDDETIAGIRRIEVAFWTEHILPRVPPPPQNLPDVMHLFRRLGETFIEATPEIEAWVAGLTKYRAEAAKLEAQIEECQFQLGCAMLGADQVANPQSPGKHVIRRGGQPLLVIDFQQQYRLNEEKIKALHPDVAEECAKIIQFFVYRIPRPKKPKGSGDASKA